VRRPAAPFAVPTAPSAPAIVTTFRPSPPLTTARPSTPRPGFLEAARQLFLFR